MKGGSNRLMTVGETADTLGVSASTIYHRWREWKLRGIFVGRSLRFRERDVENWIEKQAA